MSQELLQAQRSLVGESLLISLVPVENVDLAFMVWLRLASKSTFVVSADQLHELLTLALQITVLSRADRAARRSAKLGDGEIENSECQPTARLLPVRPGGFGRPLWQLTDQHTPRACAKSAIQFTSHHHD